MTDLRKWVEFEEIIRFVQTTPDWIEADSVCRNAEAQVAKLQSEHWEYHRERCPKLAEYRRRLRAELHRLQTIRNETHWRAAVLANFGPEAVAQCTTWIVAERAARMPEQ